MTYIVIGDNSSFHIAKITEEHKNNLVVEIYPNNTSKKVKPQNKVLTLTQSNIGDFIAQVENIKKDIDVVLLSELIDSTVEKLHINQLSDMYFSNDKNEVLLMALLLALSEHITVFENYQDGNFRKYNENESAHQAEILRYQSLDRELLQQITETVKSAYEKNTYTINPFALDLYDHTPEQLKVLELVNEAVIPNKKRGESGGLPEHGLAPGALIKFINKPDKQTKFYKVLQTVTKDLGISMLDYFCKIGLILNLPEFFLKSFLQDNVLSDFDNLDERFKNYAFPENLKAIPNNESIELFSIDGESTTEIDDAFSISYLNDGYRIGIHIAAPAIDKSLTDFVTNNISTIYYPGNKITMLPENIIEKYSLIAGNKLPVVSIYFNIDNEFNVIDYDSTLEIANIKANLRIESLEKLFNIESLEIDSDYLYEKELKTLYKFANKLEEKRGKPSVNSTVLDYNFDLIDGKVIINPRVRGNPIDKLVSELMILANCSWGRMLTNSFIPAIYRVKQPNYPVKMTLTPDSHTGLNVDYYTWSTSPLRRASDFINQYQIIGLLLQNKNCLKAMDYEILDVVENFDSKYAKYLGFQDKMEKFWSLVYLLQENIDEITGTFTYKTNVQLEGVPITIDTNALISQKSRGEQIVIKIYNINLIEITFDFKILR